MPCDIQVGLLWIPPALGRTDTTSRAHSLVGSPMKREARSVLPAVGVGSMSLLHTAGGLEGVE
jgi:hypothetical protein